MPNVFEVRDERHGESRGVYRTSAEAFAAVSRLAALPWDSPLNRAPCTSWRTCGRHYEILEREPEPPMQVASRTDVLTMSASGLEWSHPSRDDEERRGAHLATDLARTVPVLASWEPPDEAAGLRYAALGSLASTVSGIGVEEVARLSSLFDVFERCLVDNPTERNVLVVGFLEALQNGEINSGRDPARWEAMLGPHTLIAWRALIDLWAGRGDREKLLEVIGSE